MNKLDFKIKKDLQEKISMVTCYDYPSARIVAESNIDCVLVGDSVAMTMHGYNSTVMATMDMMVFHTEAVARGLKKQFLISDLPFLSYRKSKDDTIANVQRLLQAGAQAVKLEGGDNDACETIAYLTTYGVPVVGHIGLMPQSVLQMGGYHVQGRNEENANQMLQQAKNLEAAGCFALVVECIPSHLAKTITETLSIPTIGIGAGSDTDGQVLVWHDMLGLQTELNPRFVKRFMEGKKMILQAINAYDSQTKCQTFPAQEHSFL